MKRGGGGKEGTPSFPPPPRFIFCALPIFRTAKTGALADLDRSLGFPFAKNAQERLLHRLVSDSFVIFFNF